MSHIPPPPVPVEPPAWCTCTAYIVDTLDETLDCPDGWRYVPRIGKWVHA